MSISPVWIDGIWRKPISPVGRFQAVDPATEDAQGEEFPISGWDDIEGALEAGSGAAAKLKALPPETIAEFLEAFAAHVEAAKSNIAETAARETGLPVSPRLEDVELPRTVDQIRQAAAAARDRSWCMATIDSTKDLRTRFAPLGGPVAVFGPNNFPLAFNSVSGGDCAAALAAGNPVIAKGHPGHPATTRLLAEAASGALKASGLPPAAMQMIYHMRPRDGFRLAADPRLGAIAFTGNRRSGLALKQPADAAGNPIYLEMSGINPVVICPGALEERGEAIAAELAASCTLGAGQFCTNPGLILLIEGHDTEIFLARLAEALESRPAGLLLGGLVLEQISIAVERLRENGAEVLTGGESGPGRGFRFANTLLRVSGRIFPDRGPALQSEAFGPVSLAVTAADPQEMIRVIRALEGNLTGSVYTHSDGHDDLLYDKLEPALRARVGRLINDAPPTGVAVSPAMHHGGPFPATGHPGFSSVGIPRSMLRFAALNCYDRVRPHRLPPELRDANPTGRMWRWIDGEWTRRNII